MDELYHYGMPRRSGRYPWGSGENPYQRNRDWYAEVKELRKQGLSDNDIAAKYNLSSGEYRKLISAARADTRNYNRDRALALQADGYNATEIGRIMGIGESSVRNLLDEKLAVNNNLNRVKADQLKAYVDKERYIDIGPGSELEMGITGTRLQNVVKLLEEEGYQQHLVYIDQMGTGKKTTVKVLAAPGVDYQEIYDHRFEIPALGKEKIIDIDGTPIPGLEPVQSVDSSRIKIKYAEEGGVDSDGLIEIRPGVADLSLGKARYAQVRIAVDGTHYLKGMARYSDDLPPGIDIQFNTNKHQGTEMGDVLKKMKTDDPYNPFGSAIKTSDQMKMVQRYFIDPETGEKRVSPINVVYEEGDWSTWSKNLPSQMLSKQRPTLIKAQLDQDYKERKAEFDEICSLNNAAVKKKLLASFSDDCDAAAEQLKAAPLPRQQTHVLLPFNDLKDNECYAPNYREGEHVVLIRYPHGGTFEIPELVVRKNGTEADKIIHNAPDAIGINHNVAARLSGADFDGDSVTVIPVNDKVKVRSSAPLKGLQNFDPQEAYPAYPGMTPVGPKKNGGDGFNKGIQMGVVSNLITDMTLKGASSDEIARAVRHSMVVIDAEKHQLDWKKSEIDNNIAELKKIYQDNGDGHQGASTIISRAKSPYPVVARQARTDINKYNTDPETGEKINRERKDARYVKETVKKDGTIVRKEKFVTEQSTKMAEAKDAYTLTSGGSKEHPGYIQEDLYANYANQMKALANQSRKEYLATPNLERNPEAAKKYKAEVSSLNAKLNNSLKNAPLERQAQRLANKEYQKKLEDNPGMDEEHQKKAKSQALTTSRLALGAKKTPVEITDKEWEAIQSGAISHTKLMKILENSDLDKVRERAMPKTKSGLSDSKLAIAKSMERNGYSTADIADRLGVSTSTLRRALKEEGQQDG